MISVALTSQTDLEAWRVAARRLRLAEVPPEAVRWNVGVEPTLFAPAPIPDPRQGASFTTPAALISLAANVLLNRAEDRWDLMYRILWRLRDERNLLKVCTDPDVDRALSYQKAVFHATHKMHAYVRFRRLDDRGAEANADSEDTEEYAAWFEPPHFVLEKAVGFFVKRLANVRFSILTPYASARWDRKVMRFEAGADSSQVPAEDAKEEDWKVYFANVFNPARLNPKVMVQHMARHYWSNLPETALIPDMIRNADARATAMVAADPTQPSERAIKIATRRDSGGEVVSGAAPIALSEVAASIQTCRRCELWREATQGVAGEGPAQAEIVFVGEQPGDMEDLSGRPFVGPAGDLFNRALGEAGIARETTYVTNTVKHFKHELRGKRRIHKTPSAGEVQTCRWWLQSELRLIKPKVVVALGSTAAGAVFGRPIAVLKQRGVLEHLENGVKGIVTVHPSYLLRLPDEISRRAAFTDFVRDLVTAREGQAKT